MLEEQPRRADATRRASRGRAPRAALGERASRGRTVWIERRRGAEIPLAGLLRRGIPRVSLDRLPRPTRSRSSPTTRRRSACRWRCSRRCSARVSDVAARSPTSPSSTSRRRRTSSSGRGGGDRGGARARPASSSMNFRARAPDGRDRAGRASKVHGISDAEVPSAPTFAEMWPRVQAFCGDDVLVAHNGYRFDFPILERLGGRDARRHVRHAAAGARSCSGSARARAISPAASASTPAARTARSTTCARWRGSSSRCALQRGVRAQDGAGAPARLRRRRARALAGELDDEGAMLRDLAAAISPSGASATASRTTRGAPARADDIAPDGARSHRAARRREEDGAHARRRSRR